MKAQIISWKWQCVHRGPKTFLTLAKYIYHWNRHAYSQDQTFCHKRQALLLPLHNPTLRYLDKELAAYKVAETTLLYNAYVIMRAYGIILGIITDVEPRGILGCSKRQFRQPRIPWLLFCDPTSLFVSIVGFGKTGGQAGRRLTMYGE